MPYGAFRRVFSVGSIVIKVPRPRAFGSALRCNRWEREMWRKWRRKFGWENLCPVLFADPLGLFVVMPKAEAVTFEDVIAADRDYYPDIHVEMKAEDWGRIDDLVVVVDYGLSGADCVRKRRRYLASFPPNHRAAQDDHDDQ